MAKDKAAVNLGRKGGQATAKRGSNYYKRISKLAVKAKKKIAEEKNNS